VSTIDRTTTATDKTTTTTTDGRTTDTDTQWKFYVIYFTTKK